MWVENGNRGEKDMTVYCCWNHICPFYSTPAYVATMDNLPILSLSLSSLCVAGIRLLLYKLRGGGWGAN
jgi:hypothetical protein